MLGTIIERKTVEDLKASLFGTRYREQRLRLQHAGLPQVLFLIEGDLTKELFKCSADTLHTAVWETRLHLGFRIVQTAHLQDTVLMLKRMHRRILQRTFPRAFAGGGSNHNNEQLPNFAEAHRSSQQPPSLQQPPGARRRRRLQSLHEMTFDTDPVLPAFGGGMGEGAEPRFITYQELKAKIERDREAGTKTVGHIHRAMLKQVATLSSKKCQAVARVYPTVECLMRAYHDSNNNDTSTTIKELPLQDANEQQTSARNVTLGPRSAQELGIAYQTDDPEAAERDDHAAAPSQYRNNTVTVPAARTISRETTTTTTASSTTTAATATAKPAAAARLPPVPECIDLLSPPQSPAQDDDPPPRQQRQRKKSINTSFGSLLDDSFSSDDDDDVLQNRTMRSINLENNDDDDERKMPAAAKNHKKRAPSTEVIEIE